jgi:hypothetical protein
MLKLYCSECGNPTSYTSLKPKFCSGCGNSFDKTLINKTSEHKSITAKFEQPRRISPKVPVKPQFEKYDDEDDDYDHEEINHVPNISNLDCDIDEPRRNQVKIGDIIGSNKNPSRREKQKNKSQTKSERKKFLEDFQKEAGALRPKSKGRKNV